MPDEAENKSSPGEREADVEARLSPEGLITLHRIVEEYGSTDNLVPIRSDIFHSDKRVVLSALSCLARLKDKQSVGHIIRYFTHQDTELQCAAVDAVGQIGLLDSVRSMINLFKTSYKEQVRCTTLKWLSDLAREKSEVISLARAYACSQTVSEEAKACALCVILKIDDKADLDSIVSRAVTEPVLMKKITEAVENRHSLKEKIISKIAELSGLLTVETRIMFTSLATSLSEGKVFEAFLESLGQNNPESRRACYQVIGRDDRQRSRFERIALYLAENVENSPDLEEEAVLAIKRIEESADKIGARLSPQLKTKVISNIKDLFGQLSEPDRRGVSDQHELGWLITRSKEYLEYYGDDGLRQSILNYLKGSGNYSADELMLAVKRSAVKVEVRHFDGYNALLDIIKNPKRPGMAFVSRELSLAKLGKRRIMYRLIRNLYLSKMFVPAEEDKIIIEVFTWAKSAKLYRLAEAALCAYLNVDEDRTEAACIECLTPPVKSKICAIASVRLLKQLRWERVEPAVIKLITETSDPYILLNSIDALTASDFSFSGELITTVMNRLIFDNDQEILTTVAGFLSAKANPEIVNDLIDIFNKSGASTKPLIISTISSIAVRNGVSNDVGLSEFLYRVLREDDALSKPDAVTLLYYLGDEYALTIIEDIMTNEGRDEKVAIIKCLQGKIKPDVLPVLLKGLTDGTGVLHKALRGVLLNVEGRELRDEIVKMVMGLTEEGYEEGAGDYFDSGERVDVDFSHHKQAFRFEREHIQKCAVLFTDIKDYSRKAQALTSMELAKLISEYEGILLSVVTSHGGELIKRMGDGHLFIFETPLNAVLSGVRLQKALKRHNSFREEKFRVIVRIGVHWGDLVRKGNDVLGNTVNIASRLESSAPEGSVYISSEVNELVKQYVVSKNIGPVSVKGIKKPIMVFEPYEISPDLPAEMDPSNRKPAGITLVGKIGVDSGRADEEMKNYVEVLEYLKQTFISLNTIAHKVEKGEAGATEIRKEIFRRWHGIRGMLKRNAKKHAA
jgi:class 3 adenylate cyclase